MAGKFVLASRNPGKLLEMQTILGGLDIEVVLQSEVGLDLDVEETGSTFEENAFLKAQAVMQASGLPAIADDSGIVVDALSGELGVHSHRFGGEGLDDEGRNDLLLEKLQDVPDEKRTARYVCAVCCLMPDGTKLTARGETEGRILHERHGTGGFGYDPLFLSTECGRGFGEISPEEKNRLSHRGRALRQLAKQLKQYENA